MEKDRIVDPALNKLPIVSACASSSEGAVLKCEEHAVVKKCTKRTLLMSNVLVVFCLSGLSGSLTFFRSGQEKKKKNRIRQSVFNQC